MKTSILKKAVAIAIMAIPALMTSQIDLTIGLNYAYDPPASCDNKIKNLSVDICNNGSGAASSFEVGVYLYDPSASKYWIVDSRTQSSLSGNACVTLNNWNIDMNNYPALPSPGSNYRIGVWADTAAAITESNKNNNATLLAGNIQICAPAGVKEISDVVSSLNVFPNPAIDNAQLSFDLKEQQDVKVTMYDVTGKSALNVFEGKLEPGERKIQVNTSSLNTGLYFVTVKIADGTITKKMTIQK